MSSASNTALRAWMAKNPNSILGRSMSKSLLNQGTAPLAGSNTPGGTPTPAPSGGFPAGGNSSLLGRGIGTLQNLQGNNGAAPADMGNTPSGGTPANPPAGNGGRPAADPNMFGGIGLTNIPDPAGMGNTPGEGQSELFNGSIPSFAEGGLMTEQGTAVRPGQPMPTPMPQGNKPNVPLGAAAPKQMENTEIEANINHMARNPEAMEKIRTAMVQAVNSGEVTPDELNMIVQLAKVANGNPKAWPQIRQFAIQQGLATDAELPQEYDQGLVYTLLVVGKALQQKPGNTPQVQGAVPGDVTAQQPPSATQQPQPGNIPQYKDGGPTGGQAHLAVVHADEYVIPADVLKHYGSKKFGDMIKAAREGNSGNS